MALQWTSALSVGVPELDRQHQELFRRVDLLLDALLHRDRTEAARLLDFLGRYVVIHFAAEEQLMQESGYPEAGPHLAEHQHFTATLRELEAEFGARGPTAALVLRLTHEVVDWLRDHVYSTDVALGRWIQAAQAKVEARRA